MSQARQYEMKDSGVEWIGEIPKEWKICKTLFGLSMSITDGPHTTPELYDTGVPFISAEAVSCGNGKIDFSHMRGYISEDFYQECCKKYTPQKNDIYMIKSGATTGKVAIVDTDQRFTIWSPLAVFRVNLKMVVPKYLFYYLQSPAYLKQVEIEWSYGTQQNIGMRVLEQLKICLPPLDEQAAIAAYLDEKCAGIDAFIAEAKASIDDYKAWKASVIFEAVTKGLDPNAEMVDSGVEWIGKIPVNAEVIKLKYLIYEYKAGPFGSSLITGDLLPEGNILVYTPEHIAKKTVFTDKNLFLPSERKAEMSQFFVEPGDIIFPIVGSLGRAMQISSDMPHGIINQRLAKFRLNKDKVDSAYFMWLFANSSFYSTYIDLYQRGSIIVNLTKTIIGDMPFVLHGLPTQRNIAAYLDEKCEAIDGIIAEKESLIAELESYKKSLIFETVTGKRRVC